MKKSVAAILVFALYVLTLPLNVSAFDAPHINTAAGYTCATCHTSNLSLGSIGYNNMCLSCHRPGDPKAGGKSIALEDAANPFNNHSSFGSAKMQTSHRWDGDDTSPAAGAQSPIQRQMTTSNLLNRTGGQLACVRCHNQHDKGAEGKFLRIPNDKDQMCLDCHRSRNVQSHLKGSHPVVIDYKSKAEAKPALFNLPPLNSNSANPTSDLNVRLTLAGGQLLCTTCHGVHFADSRSSTKDGNENFGNLSSGDGFLLRTDRRSVQPNKMNICSNCHASKHNHNAKGQDVQCNDCHSAHVDYDPNDPTGSKGTNTYLIRRNVTNKSTGKPSSIFFTKTGSQRAYRNEQGTGVCQGCHVVPAPGVGVGKPPALHNSNDPNVCNVCHSHSNMSSSFSVVSGNCATCHGDASTLVTSGHSIHVGSKGYSCDTCHSATVSGNSTIINPSLHGDNIFEVAGSTFTTSFSTAVKTCATSCHANVYGAGTVTTPVWGASAGCASCHSVPIAASGPATGSHNIHAGIVCTSCHLPGTTATTAPASNHGNGYINVTNGYPLTTKHAAGSYTGTCSTALCHANVYGAGTVTTPVWGATAGCASCHSVPIAASGPATGSHNIHAGIVCTSCHLPGTTATTAPASNHGNGYINVTNGYPLTTKHAAGSYTGTCSTALCHGSSSPVWGANTGNDTCTKCHGTPTPTITATNRYVIAPSDPAATDTGKVSANSKTGAHMTHLRMYNGLSTVGTIDQRCQNCHGTLPISTGHANGSSTPVFKGLATNGGSMAASFSNANCNNTYCHNPAGSGGTLNAANTGAGISPNWTNSDYVADGTLKTQPNCGACHKSPGDAGFASTADHSKITINMDCSGCHGHNGDTIGTAGQQHIDGIKYAGGVAVGAPHFNNITSGMYPASYMTSNANCSNCHNSNANNQTIRKQWASSGHADNTALPWIDYDFKTRSGCVQCHTTTGFIAYSSAKTTAAWGTVSDKTKEVLTCIGCHSDVANGVVRTVTMSKPYVDEPAFTNADVGNSNICMDCHSGRNNGSSIQTKVGVADFTNLAYVAPHYLSAGGSLQAKSAYHFPGRTYVESTTNGHSKVGMSNFANTGTAGPCVTCHMSSPNKHVFKVVSSAQSGVITSISTTVCTNCHNGSLQAATIDADKVAFNSSLDILKAQLQVSGFTYSPSYPYFSATNWGTGQGGANIMGAAFNYKLFVSEPGAYAHNPTYAKQLIVDSIDAVYNGGTVTGDISNALASLVRSGAITQSVAENLTSYKNVSSCTTCHPTLSSSHAAHVGNLPSLITAYGASDANFTNPNNSDSSGYRFGCSACHPSVNANHTNGSIVLSGNGFTGTTKTNITCATSSCHSSDGGTVNYVTSPNWYTGYIGADRCAMCHAASPTTGSHSAHIINGIHDGSSGIAYGATLSCVKCHASTVDGSKTINHVNHVNGHVNVAFVAAPEVSKAQISAASFNAYSTVWTRTGATDASKRPLSHGNFAGGTCSTIACHNDGITPVWGTVVKISCVDCHLSL